MIEFNKENITEYLQNKFREIDLERKNVNKPAFNGYTNQLYLLDEILSFIYHETYENQK